MLVLYHNGVSFFIKIISNLKLFIAKKKAILKIENMKNAQKRSRAK